MVVFTILIGHSLESDLKALKVMYKGVQHNKSRQFPRKGIRVFDLNCIDDQMKHLLLLQLAHINVVDTSVVFPHKLGPPYKRALRHLAVEYLQRIIQDSGK